ncbi:MAG: polyribonucleotide nucleotidyltransferase [Clostridia bacterium]|nr:polyribonucleotide nucleotidyltransferase [Clostridia bacterium]
MKKSYSIELAGRTLTIETGELAGLANSSILVRYGDTVVLCTATASSKPREGLDYFPLSVDYEEKLYAVGKIPGSFQRREGRPSEKAILASRCIDRPMRPLFPSDLRNDVTVIATVMSVDQDNSPEIAGLIGCAIAVSVSDIPFNGPMAGVNVGYVDGDYVINPTVAQREASDLFLTVTGIKGKVNMIECGAKEAPDEVVYNGIMAAMVEIDRLCDWISGIVAEIGKPKFSYEQVVVDPEMFEAIKEFAEDKVRAALDTDDKNVRDDNLSVVYAEVFEHFAEIYPEMQTQMEQALYKLQKYVVRRWLLDEGKRVDGRGMDEIRPLSCDVGLLPRTHGSGLFTRGQTQVLSVATLAPLEDAQLLDGIDLEENKRYIHHYNFPSYSVGETRPSRGPGRREIGHGALAEKSLIPVLPSEQDFPYAIRVVSEVLSSNGSTSQASVCGSTLALMDAGVPISAPVAGISCGLVTEGDRFITMTDIQGLEDFFGDMDFKVAGTHKGITSIQVDIKIDGLTPEIIKTAIEKTHVARDYIIDEIMLKRISAPRENLSAYAPKIMSMTIPVDKIREVIGTGGKVIQKIIADTGVKISVEDDGSVYIATNDQEAGETAMKIIRGIVSEPIVGEVYKGKVTKLMDFGCFVEYLPGKEGLVHISKLDKKRVEKVSDIVSVGDEIMVKLIEIDRQGRINLSRKDALPEE